MNDSLYDYSLTEIGTHIWETLLQSSKSANTPFHQGYFATINDNIPEQRTVILRNVNVAEKSISFNTDIRSLKIEQLQSNNSVSWLFYDKHTKIQLRIYAKAVVHHKDEVSELAWENSRLGSKMCYTTQQKPGSFIENPELIEVNQLEMSDELLTFAYENFAVITSKIYAIDYVILNRMGNKRAYFNYENGIFQWRGV
jgi:pyridoxamine 5'-phosphate oxidase